MDVLPDRMLILSDQPLLKIITQLQKAFNILKIQWTYPNMTTLIGKTSKLEVIIKVKNNSKKKELQRRQKLQEYGSKFEKKNTKKKSKQKLDPDFILNNEKSEDSLNENNVITFKKNVIHFIWKEGTAKHFRDEITRLIQLSQFYSEAQDRK